MITAESRDFIVATYSVVSFTSLGAAVCTFTGIAAGACAPCISFLPQPEKRKSPKEAHDSSPRFQVADRRREEKDGRGRGVMDPLPAPPKITRSPTMQRESVATI